MFKNRVLLTFILAANVLFMALAVPRIAAQSEATADALSAAIGAAKSDPTIPFHLEVFCTDDASTRALTVYRGQIGVWNRERQVTLVARDRTDLLDMLLQAGFVDFEPRYGGRRKGDKEEAPLRVTCRILLDLQGLEKSSLQLFEGEQSAALLGLAGRLLDRIEVLGTRGVSAISLEDGLLKLAQGTLAPELLELRLLMLPPGKASGPGFILRVEAGDISRQDYLPGRLVGALEKQRIAACQLNELLDALVESAVWQLPINLRRDGLTQLEVAVLGQRKTVAGQPGFKPADEQMQSGFASLIARLQRQPVPCKDDDTAD